jgi:hypothetical protein
MLAQRGVFLVLIGPLAGVVACATSSSETTTQNPPPALGSAVPAPSATTTVAPTASAAATTSECAALEGPHRDSCLRKEEFQTFVAAHRSCTTADDCVVVATQCPFGCNVVVSKAFATETTTKHAALLEKNRAEGSMCAYKCRAPGPVVCKEHECAVDYGAN